GLDANSTGKILVNDALLELLVVLRHEKHPKGWTGVQLLGCSSLLAGLFSFPAQEAKCFRHSKRSEKADLFRLPGGRRRPYRTQSRASPPFHRLRRHASNPLRVDTKRQTSGW
ncbi:hypothetical protein, partial [Burkholderia anthina]|uniref:hypothetical protein n=1 Tax=Burkholderia anthina TaxID=179879 RepID=UPI001E3EE3A5